MPDFYNLITKICKDEKRDEIKNIQKYLCLGILHRWNEFEVYFKEKLRSNKSYQDSTHFLATLFDVEHSVMSKILDQLDLYKNRTIHEKVECDCCNVPLKLD